MGVVARPPAAGDRSDACRSPRWTPPSLEPRRRAVRDPLPSGGRPWPRSSVVQRRMSSGSWPSSPEVSSVKARWPGSWWTPWRGPPRSTWRRCGEPRCWRATCRRSQGRRWPRAPRVSIGSGWRSAVRFSPCSPRRRRRSRPPWNRSGAPPRSTGSSTASGSRSIEIGDDVTVFTRTLDPITERVPEVVEAALALPVRSIVLDGEAIALRPDGRPRPFQQTASRAARRGDVDALRREVPLTPFFFDVLRVDDAELIDLPAAERHASIDGVVPADLWVPRLVTTDAGEAPGVLRRRRRPRSRRRGGEVAGRAVRGRPSRRRVAQGQARPHAGSGGARRRVGPRPPQGMVVEPPPRRARSGRAAS